MRPDYCPVANHPCAASCESPCNYSKGGPLLEYQQALDLLCGLHPEITVDDPMEVAQRIFDHVQAERAEHQRERENDRHNLESCHALIRKLRKGTL